jgi:hypothetical protein
MLESILPNSGQCLALAIVFLVCFICLYLWMKDVSIYIGEHDLTGMTCIVTGANCGLCCFVNLLLLS